MRIELKLNNSNIFFSNSIIQCSSNTSVIETLPGVLEEQNKFLELVLEKLKNGFNDRITYQLNNSNSNTIIEKQLRSIYSFYSNNNVISNKTIKKNILRKIREQIDSFINSGHLSSITIEFFQNNNTTIGGNKKEYIKLQNGGKRLIHYGKKGGKYYIKNSKKYYIKK